MFVACAHAQNLCATALVLCGDLTRAVMPAEPHLKLKKTKKTNKLAQES